MLRTATKIVPEQVAFQRAYTAGYRRTEIWLCRSLVEDWKSIVTTANEFPMEYALHFPNRGEFEQRHLQNVVDLYHSLDSSALVIHQPMYDRYAERLFELDPYLKLGVENHGLGNMDALTEWAEESRWLTLDVEHLWHFTLKDRPLKKLMRCLQGFLSDYHDKLVHIHLPGYSPGSKFHQPQYCSRKMVMQVWSLLAEVGFPGMIVSETAAKFQNVEELQMDLLLHQRWRHENDGARTEPLQLVFEASR